MWKDRYRKANDEIPLNEELLGALLETAKEPRMKKNYFGYGFSAVAAAAIIGICIFSYSSVVEKGNGSTNMSVAEKPTPETKLTSQSEPEPTETVDQVEIAHVEQPTEVLYQQPVIVVASEEVADFPVEEEPSNEDLADIPAMASAMTGRSTPSQDQSEPIPSFEGEEEVVPDKPEETEEPNELDTQEETAEEIESEVTEMLPSPTPETEMVTDEIK